MRDAGAVGMSRAQGFLSRSPREEHLRVGRRRRILFWRAKTKRLAPKSNRAAAMELHSPAAGGTGEAEGPEDSAVRVALRVRPLGPREPGEHVCVQVEGPQRLIAGGRVFSSDFAFDGWCTQQRLYDEACAPLVARTLAGYNASIIAYGQTGSGKTFTMGSAAVNFAPPGILGVIPRAVDHLFALLAPAPPTETCQLKLSYLEIHNDQMKDLLHPHANGRNMGIREDAAGGIFVQGE
jgi:hypothetical protein